MLKSYKSTLIANFRGSGSFLRFVTRLRFSEPICSGFAQSLLKFYVAGLLKLQDHTECKLLQVRRGCEIRDFKFGICAYIQCLCLTNLKIFCCWSLSNKSILNAKFRKVAEFFRESRFVFWFLCLFALPSTRTFLIFLLLIFKSFLNILNAIFPWERMLFGIWNPLLASELVCSALDRLVFDSTVAGFWKLREHTERKILRERRLLGIWDSTLRFWAPLRCHCPSDVYYI